MQRTTTAFVGKSLGLCIVVLLVPTAGWATDPVEKLRAALKIDPTVVDIAKLQAQRRQRRSTVEKTVPALKTIGQLRQAYFLNEWVSHVEKLDAELDVYKYREEIAKRLNDLVRDTARSAAAEADTEWRATLQISVAMIIAQLAEQEQPRDRVAGGKFASAFVDVLVGGKDSKGLVDADDVRVRQVALSALGKITPKAGTAMPALRKALKSPELGPRRLAAYALSDLVRNAHHLDPKEEMATIAEAVSTAAGLLSAGPKEDEAIRGYSLQTIQLAGRIVADDFEVAEEGLIANANVRQILKAFQDANPAFVATLKSESSTNIRLATVNALHQIVNARIKILTRLEKEAPADKQIPRRDLFQHFKAPDPIGGLLAGDWEVVPGLLHKGNDARLRRAAMALLEFIADDVDPQAQRRFAIVVTPGLLDADTFIRWTAARTVAHIPAEYVDGDIVEALGHMLIDPADRDPDLSGQAAATLEGLAESKHAPKAIRFLKSAITDTEKDVEVRVVVLRTLWQIGGSEANAAFPEVTSVLTDNDVRIRRAAAETLGLLGRPLTREIGQQAIAALKNAMRDEDAQVRQNASEAIAAIVLPKVAIR